MKQKYRLSLEVAALCTLALLKISGASDHWGPTESGGGSGTVSVVSPLTGTGAVGSPISADAFLPLDGGGMTGQLYMSQSLGVAPVNFVQHESIAPSSPDPGDMWLLDTGLYTYYGSTTHPMMSLSGGTMTGPIVAKGVYLDGSTLWMTASRKVRVQPNTPGTWDLWTSDKGTSCKIDGSSAMTLNGNLTLGGSTANITSSTSGVSPIVDCTGACSWDYRDRITNSTSALLLGTTSTPTAGYNDAGDACAGGDLEVKGNTKLVGLTAGTTSVGALTASSYTDGVITIGPSYSSVSYADYSTPLFRLANTGTYNAAVVIGLAGGNGLAWSARAIPERDIPTILLYSVTYPGENLGVLEYGALYHNASDFVIASGKGAVNVQKEGLRAEGTITITGSPTTDSGIVFTVCNVTLTGRTGTPGSNEFQLGSPNTLCGNIVTAYNAVGGRTCKAYLTEVGNNTKVIFIANTAGVAGNSLVTTETTDTNNVYSFGGATLAGGRDAITGTPGATTVLYSAGNIETDGVYVGPSGNVGISNTTSYWLCAAADCSTKCQVTINGGIITGCP